MYRHFLTNSICYILINDKYVFKLPSTYIIHYNLSLSYAFFSFSLEVYCVAVMLYLAVVDTILFPFARVPEGYVCLYQIPGMGKCL